MDAHPMMQPEAATPVESPADGLDGLGLDALRRFGVGEGTVVCLA